MRRVVRREGRLAFHVFGRCDILWDCVVITQRQQFVWDELRYGFFGWGEERGREGVGATRLWRMRKSRFLVGVSVYRVRPWMPLEKARVLEK